MIRKVLLIIAVFLPSAMKRVYYRALFGWQVGRKVRIGFSFIDASQVSLGDHVRIGHFNFIRNVRQFSVGDNTYIANFNEFFGARTNDQFESRLRIGSKVQFMSHHFVDVAGDVVVGDGVTIGGRDSQIWSHSLVLRDNAFEMIASPLSIGNNVYLGARVTIVGANIPDGALVGAGSVVTRSFSGEQGRILIAGNPASIRKRYETVPAPAPLALDVPCEVLT